MISRRTDIEDACGNKAERNPVLPISLRASRRDGPHSLVPVGLRPRGPADLAGACRRQPQQLKRPSLTTGRAFDLRTFRIPTATSPCGNA